MQSCSLFLSKMTLSVQAAMFVWVCDVRWCFFAARKVVCQFCCSYFIVPLIYPLRESFIFNWFTDRIVVSQLSLVIWFNYLHSRTVSFTSNQSCRDICFSIFIFYLKYIGLLFKIQKTTYSIMRHLKTASHYTRKSSLYEIITENRQSVILLWTPNHGSRKVGSQDKNYIDQLAIDAGHTINELPQALSNRIKFDTMICYLADWAPDQPFTV